MTDREDAPEWLTLLVRGVWGEAEWRAWETVWKPTLARYGVTPDMLDDVGKDEHGRPTAIAATGPHLSWLSAPIEWDAGSEQHAILVALQRLTHALEQDRR